MNFEISAISGISNYVHVHIILKKTEKEILPVVYIIKYNTSSRCVHVKGEVWEGGERKEGVGKAWERKRIVGSIMFR